MYSTRRRDDTSDKAVVEEASNEEASGDESAAHKSDFYDLFDDLGIGVARAKSESKSLAEVPAAQDAQLLRKEVGCGPVFF